MVESVYKLYLFDALYINGQLLVDIVGKTFRGLKDSEFQAMTGRLLALE